MKKDAVSQQQNIQINQEYGANNPEPQSFRETDTTDGPLHSALEYIHGKQS